MRADDEIRIREALDHIILTRGGIAICLGNHALGYGERYITGIDAWKYSYTTGQTDWIPMDDGLLAFVACKQRAVAAILRAAEPADKTTGTLSFHWEYSFEGDCVSGRFSWTVRARHEDIPPSDREESWHGDEGGEGWKGGLNDPFDDSGAADWWKA